MVYVIFIITDSEKEQYMKKYNKPHATIHDFAKELFMTEINKKQKGESVS